MKNGKFISYFKNIILHKNYFLFHIILFLSFFIKYKYLLPYLKFPHSITLLKGNIFIMHENGIDVYDSSLNNKVKTVFNDNGLIYENILSKIEIERFSEDDNGYIISIINKTIFFLIVKEIF